MSNTSQVAYSMQKAGTHLIRVAIVDDNKSTVASLSAVLAYSHKSRIVFTARSGIDFLEKIKSLDSGELPDVVIMDVNMPGMSGVEAVRQGKILYPSVKYLMLTVFDDDETLFEAIRAGASGYLLKEERASVIAAHIEGLMEEGSVPMTSRIARKTLDLLASSDKPITGARITELEGLSSREKDVLYLMVEGLEYKEIADKLSISPHTVRKHISNIYDKLHISSKAQAIRLMQGTRTSTITSTGTRHRILLVDDHQIILDSLGMMMGTMPDIEVIGKINDPGAVMEFVRQHDVELIITDLSMPQIDGLQLAKLIKDEFPQIKIVLLTVSESDVHIHEAMAIGVEGYILKKANKEQLNTAVRTVISGERYFQDIIL